MSGGRPIVAHSPSTIFRRRSAGGSTKRKTRAVSTPICMGSVQPATS